jgi:4a-hydroxytetrahydrobiopterin dehydratase
MEPLSTRRCIRPEKGSALGENEISAFMNQIGKHWKIGTDKITIVARFDFNNFYESMAFANAVAWIANQEDHHPDLQIGYKLCTVTYTTHAAKGLSVNDFICAAKIDALLD